MVTIHGRVVRYRVASTSNLCLKFTVKKGLRLKLVPPMNELPECESCSLERLNQLEEEP